MPPDGRRRVLLMPITTNQHYRGSDQEQRETTSHASPGTASVCTGSSAPSTSSRIT
jgi:hypothetical protein